MRRRPAKPIAGSGRQFAETWWGARWIQALERLGGGWSNRLPRGREYARQGAVQNLQFVDGTVRATVKGRTEYAYDVEIGLPNLPDEAWERVLKRLTSKALYAAKLLSGEMPRDIQGVFSSAKASLFPRRPQELETSCTCPDEARPCKHVAAAHYALAETLDRDPFLLFELRGRSRDEVLKALRALRGKRASTIYYKQAAEAAQETEDRIAEEGPPPPDPAAYGDARDDLTTLGFHISAPDVTAAAVRALGPPRSWPEPLAFLKAFAGLYRDASALALDIAWGSEDEVPESARLRDPDDDETLEAMASSMPTPLAPGTDDKPPGWGAGPRRRGTRRRRRGGRSRRGRRKSGRSGAVAAVAANGGGGGADGGGGEGAPKKKRRRRGRRRGRRGRGKKKQAGGGGES